MHIEPRTSYFGGGSNETCSGVFPFSRYFFWIFDFRLAFTGSVASLSMFLAERELFSCWSEEELLSEVDEPRGISGAARPSISRTSKAGTLIDHIIMMIFKIYIYHYVAYRNINNMFAYPISKY